MPKLNDGVAMWNGSVQVSHNPRLGGGITTINNHRAGYINSAAVHKHPSFTLPTTPSKPPLNPLNYFSLNRLFSSLIPTVHRAYIYDQNFNLINIL